MSEKRTRTGGLSPHSATSGSSSYRSTAGPPFPPGRTSRCPDWLIQKKPAPQLGT
jgi:hypothetical protein